MMNATQRIKAIRCPIDAQILIDQVHSLGYAPGFVVGEIRTADDAETLATQLMCYAEHLSKIAENARDLSNMLDGLSDDLRQHEEGD